ncbi:hypothetical protein QJQ45_005304 [Haematococcus lacustris]|nr:hypothetical protein QJQ45_005304 [Haematococcus lacustris]
MLPITGEYEWRRTLDRLPVTDAQLTDTMPAPSPPIFAPRPPASSLPTPPRPPVPSLSRPPPQQLDATGIKLVITFYGLDLWSLINSWGSRIEALLEGQLSPSLSLQDLSAPGMCASQLLALNTTALFDTFLTAQDLMPGLDFFAMDVAQLLRDYLRDSSITVQVTDFCAGNRTAASFLANNTLVNGPWPTLRVTINLLTTEPESRGALMTRASLDFFNRYGMPFHRCQVSLLPGAPPPSPSPPSALPPSLTLTPSAPLSWLCGAVCCADPAAVRSVFVSGPLPATTNIDGDPSVLFGPIIGNGRNVTFTTCFPGNVNWDSRLALDEIVDVTRLQACGGELNAQVGPPLPLHLLGISNRAQAGLFLDPSVVRNAFVSSPYPVNTTVDGDPVVMFGPITGNGRRVTFTTCF